jgi:hypothetical protein
MTKLNELLGKTGRREAEPLGFGRSAKRADRTPDILLIGRIGAGDLAGFDVNKSSVDSFLLEADEVDEKLLQAASTALEGAVWGVKTKRVTSDAVEALKQSEADFIVFAASTAPASVLSEEELGCFLQVDSDMSEEDAQAVHALPVDGVAIEVGSDLFPFTVETLMRLHRALSSGEHAIVLSDFDPAALSTGDLEAMRNAGVSALALSATGKSNLESLRKAIADLPEPKSAHDERLALIPHVSSAGEDEDFGDEGDDF